MFKRNKSNESEIMKYGFLGGIAQAAYTLAVVLVMQTVGEALPQEANETFGTLLFLLLFVFSVAMSGVCVFGYPAYLVLQKRYPESVFTFLTTMVTLAIIAILVFIFISYL